MKPTKTPIDGLLVFEPTVFHDERGYFCESFNQKLFNEALAAHEQKPVDFVQDNESVSKYGVIRGLHYQMAPYAQGKLVRVTHGAIWDVAIDIRRSSPTFGQWFGLELSAVNKKQLWIPVGFAHGFLCLHEDSQVMYKTTNHYQREYERSIHWQDLDLAISWPSIDHFIVNGKDKNASPLMSADLFP